jgi:hypothetical protein
LTRRDPLGAIVKEVKARFDAERIVRKNRQPQASVERVARSVKKREA